MSGELVFRARPIRLGREVIIVLPDDVARELEPGKDYEFHIIKSREPIDDDALRVLSLIRRLARRKGGAPMVRDIARYAHMRYMRLACALYQLAERGLVEVLDDEGNKVEPDVIPFELRGRWRVAPLADRALANVMLKRGQGQK